MSSGDSPTPDPDEEDDPLETVVFGVTSALIFAVGFGLLAVGVPWFWIVFPVGFAGVLPAVVGLTKLYQRQQTEPTDQSTAVDEAALEELRSRYARGEIDEAEFERRLEALLETESIQDAAEYANRERARE